MTILDFLLGRPLATSEEKEQRVGPAAGIPMLGLDALASSAYGPEAALTILIPLGAAGIAYGLPISFAIIALLAVVYLSYRQTISAYPNGGGSYTVARENLGKSMSLLAAAALMLDYVLVVAVGVSAGVGAFISAIPNLQPYTLELCLGVLILITVVNLRGVRESGLAFMVPTYIFVVSLFVVLGVGLIKTLLAHGHPVPIDIPPSLPSPTQAFSFWLVARAFASGCTAMTGVEAVSNGVTAFREPVVANARRTLSLIIGILILLLAGIAYLANAYGIGATEPGQRGYESIISQLVGAVLGKGIAYGITIGSVIAVLALSANTGFADFPRMCQIIAKDGYLPSAFSQRGRRLVFSYGILFIAALSGLLLIIFGGVTDRLIPLFAVGAFLAFTLSQAGMVVHWWKRREERFHLPILINGAGTIVTGVTLVIVLLSKFTEGAWITLLIIPGLLFLFRQVRRHYVRVARQIASHDPVAFETKQAPIVLIPLSGWNRITRKAVNFAVTLSEEVYGVHVRNEEHSNDPEIRSRWEKLVEGPAKDAGVTIPKLMILPCPYRTLFGSFINFVDQLEKENPGRQIAVIIPNLVEFRWYHYFLHNQRGVLLNAALLVRKDPRIIVITVPWYLSS